MGRLLSFLLRHLEMPVFAFCMFLRIGHMHLMHTKLLEVEWFLLGAASTLEPCCSCDLLEAVGFASRLYPGLVVL